VFRYHQGQLYIIDVSQSVEYDHPNALEFLRKDCVNVNTYFRRRLGVAAMTSKELFDFITDLSISDDNIDSYLSALMKSVTERSHDEMRRLDAEDEVKRSVRSLYIEEEECHGSSSYQHFDVYQPSWAVHSIEPVFITRRVRTLAVLDIGVLCCRTHCFFTSSADVSILAFG